MNVRLFLTGDNPVYLLQLFNENLVLGLDRKIDLFKTLVQVRNCIVHAAGLLDYYKYECQLREGISGLEGIKVSDITFLGEGVEN